VVSVEPIEPQEAAKPTSKVKAKQKQKPKIDVAEEAETESVMATKASSESSEINLGDSLSIQDVAQLLVDIGQAFDLAIPIKLKGGDVDRIDGAGLQLLSMLMKTGEERDVKISWNSASESIIEGAKQLGIQDQLQLQDSEQAA
jgi:ABC-type transporter Mla MlaB component